MPFLRLSFYTILGILIGDFFFSNLIECLVGTVLLGIIILVQSFYWNTIRSRQYLYSFSIFLFFVFLGAYAQKVSHYTSIKSHFTNYLDDDSILVARVQTAKHNKASSYYTSVFHVLRNDSAIDVKGELLVKSYDHNFKEGDVISFNANVLEFKNNENSYAFDQKKFYNSRGIYHYTYPHEINLLKSNISSLEKARISLLTRIDNLNISSNSKGLTKAMLLGDKAELGELETIFRKTGTSHVLAISGLHVGIIATLLFFLFNSLPKRFENLKYVLVILGVWLFCLLSGAQPSTLRSSVMLTCFLVGKSFKRTGLAYNYCFAAAFFMLLHNPGLIYDIGFQFSFLAIFGILFFYDILYKALQFKGFLNYAWQLCSVSLSAQLMIAPLSLYYFHDFPILFPLTSLIAIPITFIVIAFSSLTLILDFSFLNFLSLEPVLDWIIVSFVDLLEIFAHNEDFLISGLFPDISEIIIYFISLFALVIFFKNNRKIGLVAFASSYIVLLFLQFSINKRLSDSQIVIYAHPSHIMIDVISGGSSVHFYDNDIDASKADWISKNYRTKLSSRNIEKVKLENNNQELEIENIKIGIAYNDDFFKNDLDEYKWILLKKSLDVNCLIGYENKVIDYSKTHKNIFTNNKQIIFKI